MIEGQLPWQTQTSTVCTHTHTHKRPFGQVNMWRLAILSYDIAVLRCTTLYCEHVAVQSGHRQRSVISERGIRSKMWTLILLGTRYLKSRFHYCFITITMGIRVVDLSYQYPFMTWQRYRLKSAEIFCWFNSNSLVTSLHYYLFCVCVFM